MHVVVYFKCLPQICTKMNGLKFDFSKNFWGGAHRAPSPDPSPRFLSGFALGSGFALNSQALRSQLSIGKLGLAPQNKFLDPPLIYNWYTKCVKNVCQQFGGHGPCCPLDMPLEQM